MRRSLFLIAACAAAAVPLRADEPRPIVPPSAAQPSPSPEPGPGPEAKPAPAPSTKKVPSVVPAATTVDRYKPIWVRSPFSVASATDEPGGDWVMTGLASSDEGPVVFLFNRQNQKRTMVTSKPDAEGMSVESIDYQPDYLASSAKIKTSSDTLTVKFDKNLVSSAQASPPPGPGGPGGIPSPMIHGATITAPPPIPSPSGSPVTPRIIVPNPPAGQIPRPIPHP